MNPDRLADAFSLGPGSRCCTATKDPPSASRPRTDRDVNVRSGVSDVIAELEEIQGINDKSGPQVSRADLS